MLFLDGRSARKLAHARRAAVIAVQRDVAAALRKRHHCAARCIQRAWRRHQLMQRAVQHLRSIVTVQQRWRRMLQRRLVQQRRHVAATILQAAWRGYSVRHLAGGGSAAIEEPQKKRLTVVRKRLNEATSAADETKCIGHKTKCAIFYLFKYKDLKRILQAVICLDTSTRWSSVCCSIVVKEGIVPHLFNLVDSCNRSLPYMQILSYTINIILNLVKCEQTYSDVMQVRALVMCYSTGVCTNLVSISCVNDSLETRFNPIQQNN